MIINEYSNVLLTSEDYIKSTTNISENISGNYLLPAIKLAQDIELNEAIGTNLLRYLQMLVGTSNINNEENAKYKYLLDVYIQPYLSYLSITNLAPTLAFKLNNFGVMRSEDEKAYNATANEIDKVAYHYKHLADSYLYQMQRFLIANYNYYPQLMQYKTLADLRANLYSAASCNLFLGGARGKRIFNSSYLDYGYNFPNSDINL